MPASRRMSGVLALILLSTVFVHAQLKELQRKGERDFCAMGNLYCDFVVQQRESGYRSGVESDDVFEQQRYSPLQAAVFSAIVPGAGQFYTKSYWQSAAFLGAEVLLWIVYANHENRGDRQTSDFQNYADANWSVVRYANWIRLNYSGYYRDDIFKGAAPPNDDVSNPWDYINWSVLNEVEDQIGQLATTGQLTGFSHDLPPRPDQQYYEEIGKYPQYGGGWNDAASFKAGGFTAADLLAGNVSPNFLSYSRMRGDANRSYNVATAVSYIIVANHVFSAIEAAWNASRINNKIHLQGHIQPRVIQGGVVEFVPTVDFEIGL